MRIHLHMDDPQRVTDAWVISERYGVRAIVISVAFPAYVQAEGTVENIGNWLKEVERLGEGE